MLQSKSIAKIWIYLVGIIVIPIVLSIILGILQAIAGENNISDGFALSVINLNRRRISLFTPVLISALFTYHNLTILLKACNSIFYEIAHAILLQLIHI